MTQTASASRCGGNLINYPGELTTRTADLTTAKILWNSTISTPGARFACADIENMYLQTPMSRYKYMRIKADLVPTAFKNAYNLWDKINNGYIYMEIRRGCYGLPQAGILANKLLKKRLATDGYFELPHTPGLFKHISCPVQFSLVVDKFGIKYIGKEHLDHLITAINIPQAGILANKLLKKRLATDGYSNSPHPRTLQTHQLPSTVFSCLDDFGIKYSGQEHLNHLIQAIKRHYASR
eukprot:CCRYP_009401-RA/>CCRYP_009401-RA protein AED:0.38 eAED:0.38 QI:0/0/0/1/0/0/2/0/237